MLISTSVITTDTHKAISPRSLLLLSNTMPISPSILLLILLSLAHPAIAGPVYSSGITTSKQLLGPGWNCLVSRRYLCDSCLPVKRALVCKFILLNGRKVKYPGQSTMDDFPSHDKANYVWLSNGRPLCAGFLSHLLANRACTIDLCKGALVAEGLAQAAKKRFEPHGGNFTVVRTAHGKYLVRWKPPNWTFRPGDHQGTVPQVGNAAVTFLTTPGVLKQWSNLLRDFFPKCHPTSISVGVGGWSTQTAC